MIFSASASFGAVWPLGFGFFGLFGGAFAPPNKPFFTFRLIQGTRLHTSQRVDIGEQVRRGDGKGRLDVHALQPNAERPPQSSPTLESTEGALDRAALGADQLVEFGQHLG